MITNGLEGDDPRCGSAVVEAIWTMRSAAGERPPSNETRSPMKMKRFIFLIILSLVVLGFGREAATPQPSGPTPRRVIIFVWDGLRADDITLENMPNYFALARSGVVFSDHHAVYPTFTMMNSASIATGTYPGATGSIATWCTRRKPRGRTPRGDRKG